MRLFAEFRSGSYDTECVELNYSILHFLINNNPRWFCRIWKNYKCKWAYGKTKFEAYRKALNKKWE